MTLPIHFATLHGGPQMLSLFDRQFAAIGNLTTIPCTYSVTPDGNTITLTPYVDTPALHRYTDLSPQFIFYVTGANTGPVTINVIGVAPQMDEVNLGSQQPGSGWPSPPPPMPLGARPAFKAGGSTALEAGDLLPGVYVAVFAQNLNGGNGGFAIAPYGSPLTGTWQTYTPTVTSASGNYATASASGNWLQVGNLVFFEAVLTVSNKGSGGGALLFSPPPVPVSLSSWGVGTETGTGNYGIVQVSSPSSFLLVDGGDPIPSGGGIVDCTAWYPTGA